MFFTGLERRDQLGHAGKEVPSPREDGGFSGVSSSCGVRGAFLMEAGAAIVASRVVDDPRGAPGAREP